MAGGSFGGGTGSSLSPYLVEDAADLNAVKNYTTKKYFRQTQNIDLTSWGNWAPGNLHGDYDGRGYDITGLRCYITIDSSTPTAAYDLGLFKEIFSTGTLHDVNIIDADVGLQFASGFDPSEYDRFAEAPLVTAGIAAARLSYGYIKRVRVTGNVSGTNHLGGLIGFITAAYANCIVDSCALVTLRSYCWFTYALGFYRTAGPLTGTYSSSVSTASMSRCYTVGVIYDCAASGCGKPLTSGYFFGYIAYSSYYTLTNCFYDSVVFELSEIDNPDTLVGTPLTTTQMKDSEYLTNFNFNVLWLINVGVNDGYAYLSPHFPGGALTLGTDCAATTSLYSTDWPKYAANPQNTGLSLADTSASDGSLIVDATLLTPIEYTVIEYNDLTVTQDTLFIGGCNADTYDEELFAIDKATLAVKWHYPMTNFTTPLVDKDSNVYLVAKDGIDWNVYLYCFDPDGQIVWQYQLIGGTTIRDVNMDSNGVLYCATEGSQTCLYAINPDGTLKWSYLFASYTDGYGVQGRLTSIACSNGEIYVALRSLLMVDSKAINQKLELFVFNSSGSIMAIHLIEPYMGLYSYGACMIAPDNSVYVATQQGRLFKLSKNDGIIWNLEVYYGTSESWVGITPDGNILAAQVFGGILCCVSPDGSILWQSNDNYYVQCSPKIGSDGSIYFYAMDSQGVACIKALNSDGTDKWTYYIPDDPDLAYIEMSAIDQEGTIWFVDDYLHVWGFSSLAAMSLANCKCVQYILNGITNNMVTIKRR